MIGEIVWGYYYGRPVYEADAGSYLDQLALTAALPKSPNARTACEYCATPHSKNECPNCGGPAKDQR